MAEAEAKKRVPTTFASRAAQHQGDIISCEQQFKVNSFRRGSSQELFNAILTQNVEVVERLCRLQPELAKLKDKDGNMAAHIAAKIESSADICGMIIEAYPEALVISNGDGFVPGTLVMKNPAISRDCQNMMQDGRTSKKGNWVYDRYEKERHAHAIEYSNQKVKRSMEADAVRHTVAGYVAPRNKAIFLSAHESAR